MNLRLFRRVAGLSQRQLHEKSGVDLATISRLENQLTEHASYENTVRLARALNMTAEELDPIPMDLPPPSEPAADPDPSPA